MDKGSLSVLNVAFFIALPKKIQKVWEEVSLPPSPKPDPVANIQLKVPITPKLKALTPG